MSQVVLLFPHQLFSEHPLLAEKLPVVLIEDSLFFGDPEFPANFHTQKRMFHRATMRRYADSLTEYGYVTTYLEYVNAPLSGTLLKPHLPAGTTTLLTLPLFDDILEQRLRRCAEELGMTLHIHHESPYLMMPLDELNMYFSKKPPLRQHHFYERRRRATGILMVGDTPSGGRWSFDTDNRKKMPTKLLETLPKDPHERDNEYITEARAYVARVWPESLGSADTYWYPTETDEAKIWLSQFFEERFRDFGAYEDAIVPDKSLLYHSLLSPLINSGLLTPKYVITRAYNYAQENDVPLNSLEGFVRQILGWREFVMGSYLHHGRALRSKNIWNHKNPLPQAFYDGTTGILPVDTIVKRVLQTGYCHHIERLMILGNIMFLLRIHPDHIYRWFMELFIDSYDWVMVPNVYGMSQNAAGDFMTTKPYFSGSNYILKMSNFPRGAWCDEWDALYWTFIEDNQERLAGNHRWALMLRQLAKKTPEQREKYRALAGEIFSRLNL